MAPFPPNADYQVGNLNQPEGPPLEGYFDGHQMIAYFIAPREQCDCPEGGFKLESVNHLLYFADLQEPAVFSVRAGLLAAEYDQSTASWVPGQILCESLPMTVTIQEPGIQQVQVPTAECESMSLEENYFLYLAYEIGVPGGAGGGWSAPVRHRVPGPRQRLGRHVLLPGQERRRQAHRLGRCAVLGARGAGRGQQLRLHQGHVPLI